jgi:predicted DNA-binding transcriptional regulator AlpA
MMRLMTTHATHCDHAPALSIDADADGLMRIQAVAQLLGGASRATIWRYVHRGLLPRPVHLGSAALWQRREIVAAIERLLATRVAEAGAVADLAPSAA